jgi:hypothetical protein
MVMLGLLNAYYIHLGTFWTVAFFAIAAFAFLGVPLRLLLARAVERSAQRKR